MKLIPPTPESIEWFAEDQASSASLPLPSASRLSSSAFLCAASRVYWRGAKSQRESQVIYKSFNTLCPTLKLFQHMASIPSSWSHFSLLSFIFHLSLIHIFVDFPFRGHTFSFFHSFLHRFPPFFILHFLTRLIFYQLHLNDLVQCVSLAFHGTTLVH